MNGSISRRHQWAILSYGLTVIVDPDNPNIDIVFVHGFTGHPERTWTHKKGEVRPGKECDDDGSVEPPSKSRRLNLFSTSRHANGPSSAPVYWPEDLLPLTTPGARVLTYGYDTHIGHTMGRPVTENTVYDIAWDFLLDLEAERRKGPLRPLLFIAHSLGGIIVKEMLRRASGCKIAEIQLHSVFESTVGIIFFGTPHAGADPRGILQRVAEKVAKAAGFRPNDQIIQSLLPSAERLRELRDEFGPMAQERNWKIHSFQEQVGVNMPDNRKIVEDTSSCLHLPTGEITQHIHRNHMQMCRFTGLDDGEYKKVAAALGRIETAVPQTLRDRSPPMDANQRRELLDSLGFSQIDARHMTIKNAHAKTCKWLLKRPEYLSWLDPVEIDQHHGFLWIKGKPGSGKSTLMKFLLVHARKKIKNETVISFFFNARGNDLEKSTSGMYRSLLSQLLERFPALQVVLDSLGLSTRSGGCPQWSIESLEALFKQSIETLGESSVLCLIDALDECDERQIRNMVSFFEQIGDLAVSKGFRFRVCFSSRHYPHITIRQGLDLVLEGQEGHAEDITDYISSELKIGRSKLAETIRLELQEKAAGVFMWVILVVEILNKQHDGGRIHTLRRRLGDIPADLHDLFRSILTRDDEDKDELILCIQWVLFAKQPLRPEQLYFAIRSGVEPDELTAWDPNEATTDTIKRFILSSSKGLTEITKSKSPTVQFIHESVVDFLLKEKGLSQIWPGLQSQLEGQSHEKLKRCCVEYMGVDISSCADLSISLAKASSEEAAALRHSIFKTFPLLEYAVHNVLYHADVAEGLGIAQKDFLTNFCHLKWVRLNNLFERHKIRHYTPNVSLLYILAERNFPNLIRGHSSVLSCMEVENERYGPPFVAALCTGSEQAVEVFRDALVANSLGGATQYRSQYSRDNLKRAGFSRHFKFPKDANPLSYLSLLGDEALFTSVLAMRKFNVNDKYDDGWTLLESAASKEQEVAVQLLLNAGADIHIRCHDDRTLLHKSVVAGSKAIVSILLDKGADIEAKDNDGQTPLHCSHSSDVTGILLDRGADIEAKDNSGQTPLHCSYSSDIIGMLLDRGANIEAKDHIGKTPLHCSYSSDIIGMLLDRGANIEAKDNNGRTPLYCSRGPDRIGILLDRGADVNARDNIGWTTLHSGGIITAGRLYISQRIQLLPACF
ncbi:hypothetical protein F5B20DRAFT_535599 [Whalleya microplaca]|nr:hypothetical protein F5B20DRAFT_535599 [Whalleya microplaca]